MKDQYTKNHLTSENGRLACRGWLATIGRLASNEQPMPSPRATAFASSSATRPNTAAAIIALLACSACAPRALIRLHNPQLKTYSSCEALKADYSQTTTMFADYYSGFVKNERVALGAPANSIRAPQTIVANPQTAGIEEPDVLKLSQLQIFYVTQDAIVVLDRITHKQIGSLDISHLSEVKLFTSQSRLWIVGRDRQTWGQTLAGTYRLSSKMPIFERTQSFDGSLLDARVKEDKLILVLNGYLASDKVEAVSDKLDEVSCDRVTQPIINDNDWSAVKIISMSTESAPEVLDAVELIGSGSTLYMSQDNLYLIKSGVNLCGVDCNPFYGQGDPNSDFSELQDSSFVTQIRFVSQTGHLEVKSLGVIKGSVKDSWALNEFQENEKLYVAVASTQQGFSFSNDALKKTNHLYVLEQDGVALREVGGVHDFGNAEDIRAVRFVDRMAYVVTFEKTDPLWSISLENLSAPLVLGRLEVPGFSTYLHPVSTQSLIGVGLDAIDQGPYSLLQGIQLSLFDVSHPESLLRKDNLIFGGRGSYSHASSDRNAFYYDALSKIVAIPTMEFSQVPAGDWDMGQTRLFSGARFFKIDESQGRIQQLDAVSHFEMVPAACASKVYPRWGWAQSDASVDIQRIIQVDGTLITLSPFGEKTWQLSSEGRMTPMQVEPFRNLGAPCAAQSSGYVY